MNKYNSRKPFYESDLDFKTNAPSYYEALARFNESLKQLTERMNDVEQRFKDLIEEWVDDGTLARLITQLMLDEYATMEWVTNEIIEKLEVFKADLNERMMNLETDLTNEMNLVKDSIDNLINELTEYSKREKIIYTVGANGDFTSINNAINEIEKMLIYPNEVELKLLNDYVMNEQVIIKDRDFSFITISSANPVSCQVVDDIKTITTMQGAKYTPFFHIKNAYAPRINALFNQTSPYNEIKDRVSGIVLENSEIFINERMGFTNFSWGGLVLLDKSNGVAIGGNFNGNGNYDQVDPTIDNVRTAYKGKGVLVQNSSFTGDGLTANHCGDVGVHVQLASNARFSNAEINYCGHHAIVVSQSSSVTARNGDYSFAQDDNVVCETGGHLDISYSNCSNAHFNNGIVAHRNGTITFIDGTANENGGWGIHAVNDGHINAEGATSNNNGRSGISTGRMGYVYFRWGTSNGNGNHGINVSKISHVVAVESQINNNTLKGVAVSGGEADVSQSEIRYNGESGVASVSGGKVTISSSDTNISNNNDYGILSENGEITVREATIINNVKGDVRVSKSGRIHGNDITTTNTTDAMYIVSTGGMVNVSDSIGYVNMATNVIQERGVVITNTLKQEGK